MKIQLKLTDNEIYQFELSLLDEDRKVDQIENGIFVTFLTTTGNRFCISSKNILWYRIMEDKEKMNKYLFIHRSAPNKHYYFEIDAENINIAIQEFVDLLNAPADWCSLATQSDHKITIVSKASELKLTWYIIHLED
jgi:hypothetical protein